ECIRETNRAMDAGALGTAEARAWLQWWDEINQVLGLDEAKTPGLPSEIGALAQQRAQARLAKDFWKSDELRDELSARGWDVRDTKDGQKITRRAGNQP